MKIRNFTPVMDISFWKKIHFKKLDDLKLSEESFLVTANMKCSKFNDDKVFLHFDSDSLKNIDYKIVFHSFHSINQVGFMKIINIESTFKESIDNLDSHIQEFRDKNPEINVVFAIIAYINHKTFAINYSFVQIKSQTSYVKGLTIDAIDKKVNFLTSEELIKKSKGLIVGTFEDRYVFCDTSQGNCTSSVPFDFILNNKNTSFGALLKQEVEFYLIRGPFSLLEGTNQNVIVNLITIKKLALEKIGIHLKTIHDKVELNLKSFLSPESLLEEQANLNLKLMKWRLEPNLDLDLLFKQKALILGSGTLGCNLARLLLGYGFRHLTFLDCGKVSYSNLARQSLFTTDCFDEHGEGLFKAEAACLAIKKIAPYCKTKFVNMKIPMPGHFVTPDLLDSVNQDLNKLEDLITSHDVIFNVFDSREARYFPTTIGALYNKNVISIGIGYESYIIVQHGCYGVQETKNIHDLANTNLICENKETKEIDQTDDNSEKETEKCNKHLIDENNQESDYGCFFCSDYITPVDSMSNRSMDQQCTVSRPGVSMQASAIAIEMYINNLHEGKIGAQSNFIRGCSGGPFELMQFENRRFSGCIACSKKIVEKFASDRKQFLFYSLNESKSLYNFTGFVVPNDNEEDDSEIVMIDDSVDIMTYLKEN